MTDLELLQGEIDLRKPGEEKHGQPLVLEPRRYYLERALVVSGYRPFTLIGAGGYDSTVLQPTNSNGNVLTITDSQYVHLQDFRIDSHNVDSSCGIVLASVPPSPVDAFSLSRVRVDGRFSKAAFFCLSHQSSRMERAQFYNYLPAPAMVMTSDNGLWQADDGSQVLENPGACATGWAFYDCEWHNFAAQGGWACWLGNVCEAQWFGGNMSTQAGHPMLSVNAAPHPWQETNYLKFIGTRFYTDDGSAYSKSCVTVPGSCSFDACKGHKP